MHSLIGLVLWVFAAAADGESTQTLDPPLLPLVEHVRAHPEGEAPWSIDLRALERDRAGLPIGVFDSGIGGLTVMEAILTLDTFNNRTLQPGADGVPDFAGERFVYFGDQANMPYGNYPAHGRESYLRELILKDAVFLLGRRYHGSNGPRFDKPPAKAIVIACNTATAFGLEDIRTALRAWKLEAPVIGVVEAGARAVSERLPAEGQAGAVAVLATVGTCKANAYPKAIGRATGLAGKPLPAMIQHGSAGLAGAIESNPAFVCPDPANRSAAYLGPALGNAETGIDAALLPAYHFDPKGLVGDPSRPETLQLNSPANYARYDVTTLLEQYRKSGGGPAIAAVVLGCTHFPIIQPEIENAFARLREFRHPDGTQPYRGLIAERPDFVSPAEFTAKELFRELARKGLRVNRESTRAPVLAGAFLSVPNPEWAGVKLAADGSLDNAYKYGREAGRPEVEDVRCVPMQDAALSIESLAGLARALPVTWKELRLPRSGDD
ncbi:MAG: aspartate/glutamate racemase family protein [Verrucomicrobiota bacterium]|nr:aspartate/glutamate racemase family protein [Verrucomicrobiota bacterium]